MNKLYPHDWRVARFGEFIRSVQNGFGRRPSGREDGPIVLRLADVSKGYIDLSNVRRVRMSEGELEKYHLRKNDLLFIRVNGSRDVVARCVWA